MNYAIGSRLASHELRWIITRGKKHTPNNPSPICQLSSQAPDPEGTQGSEGSALLSSNLRFTHMQKAQMTSDETFIATGDRKVLSG